MAVSVTVTGDDVTKALKLLKEKGQKEGIFASMIQKRYFKSGKEKEKDRAKQGYKRRIKAKNASSGADNAN